MTDIHILIPARMGSSRFPGKPLFSINGKPLIQHTYEAAQRVGWEGARKQVTVLTDSYDIADAVMEFGGQVVITSTSNVNGTERCAEAVKFLVPHPNTIVINWQGDAPLTPPRAVYGLVARLATDPTLGVATPICIEPYDESKQSTSQVSVITNMARTEAVYFTRRDVPFKDIWNQSHVIRHVGMYAYRVWALDSYKYLERGHSEQFEDLEQLRFLEHGIRVGTVEIPLPARPLVELNTESDILPLMEQLL